jgi:uncharacterized membrane protein
MGLVGPAAYLLMSGPLEGHHALPLVRLWERIMYWELAAFVMAIIGLLCTRRQRVVWGWAVLQNLAAVVFMYSLVPIE